MLFISNKKHLLTEERTSFPMLHMENTSADQIVYKEVSTQSADLLASKVLSVSLEKSMYTLLLSQAMALNLVYSRQRATSESAQHGLLLRI